MSSTMFTSLPRSASAAAFASAATNDNLSSRLQIVEDVPLRRYCLFVVIVASFECEVVTVFKVTLTCKNCFKYLATASALLLASNDWPFAYPVTVTAAPGRSFFANDLNAAFVPALNVLLPVANIAVILDGLAGSEKAIVVAFEVTAS